MTNDVQTLISEVTGLLKSLIAIPSLSRKEEQAANFLQNYIEVQGMTTGGRGNNIQCLSPMFDLQRPTLLLDSHIDTMKPINGWWEAPFNAAEENDKTYGLGSNDIGASMVGLLQVFLQLCRIIQAYNLIFLTSYEEKVPGKGGIEFILPQLPPIQFAIVGEPTEIRPAIAEESLVVLDVTAYGRSGHAARSEGDSTIYKVLGDIVWFHDYHFPKESPFSDPVRMSIIVTNAGMQYNIIPDRCMFVIDIHSNECYTSQGLFDKIRKHISHKAKARSFRLGSSRISPDHPLVRKAVALGRVPFDSPTLSDQALMLFPSAKMGPGKSDHSHATDEFIFVKKIEEAITLYLELLDRAGV